MKDRKYWEEVGELIDKLRDLEKEVFNLALDLDGDITAQEAKKTSSLTFNLWEAVANYKCTLAKLEKLEDKRFGDILRKMDDSKDKDGQNIIHMDSYIDFKVSEWVVIGQQLKEQLKITGLYEEELSESEYGAFFAIAKRKLEPYINSTFIVLKIDLDPENWIITHPVTICLNPLGTREEIYVNVDRNGRIGKLPAFKKTGREIV